MMMMILPGNSSLITPDTVHMQCSVYIYIYIYIYIYMQWMHVCYVCTRMYELMCNFIYAKYVCVGA
jgi:hypothetical protein